MTLFGKILTVFNLLAAVGFLVLAGMDYSKRQQWAYSVFRHELAISGLPVDDHDDSWRLPGSPIGNDLSTGTLTEVFAQAGGAPVKTQLAEVELTQKRIVGEIDAAENETKAREILAGYLLPLADSAGEREQWIRSIDPRSSARKPVPELKAMLEQRFAKVLEPVRTGSAAGDIKHELEVKKQQIADLLYNLNPTGAPIIFNRVQNVVGLNQYILAADRQALKLSRMANQVQNTIAEDQAAFGRHNEEVYGRLKRLSEQLASTEARLNEQKKLVEQNTTLLNARTAEEKKLEDDLRKASEAAYVEANKLTELQKTLFDLQRELSLALQANQKLEQDIRTKELGK